MDDSILFLLCICWLLYCGPAPCEALCKVIPRKIVDRSNIGQFYGDFQNGVDAYQTFCSQSPLSRVKIDFSPYLAVNFDHYNPSTMIGIGIKGGYNINQHKNFGFPSVQIYSYASINSFIAIKEGNPLSSRVKTFPGLSKADIVAGKLKRLMFDYPTQVTKLKIYFKLKLGQKRVCLRIEFYQKEEKCNGKTPVVNKCLNNTAGCEYTCITKPGTFNCGCPAGQKLWRDGLHCQPAHPYHFTFSTEMKTYEQAQYACLRSGGILSVIYSRADFVTLFRKRIGIHSVARNVPYLIGLVDVDYDLSYNRFIDGSDVISAGFQWERRFPGSSCQFMAADYWTFTNKYYSYYTCRVGKEEDSYLFSGYHGIEDFQFSSSPFLTKISLASNIAFGTARSRRGSKGYAITHSGDVYGLLWRPSTKVKRFLKITMQLENVIRGVSIFGSSCTTLAFTMRYKTFNEMDSHNTKIYYANTDEEKLIFIKRHTLATEFYIRISDNSDCIGYQWDLIGYPSGRNGVDECLDKHNPPCHHICLNTPESYYCRCNVHYHLFIDGKTCLPAVRPYLFGPMLMINRNADTGNEYFEFKNALQTIPESHKYYEFFPEVKDFSAASQMCRKFGGYLPAIHKISDHRLLYGNLTYHRRCNKWLLGLKGKSLLHSSWQDGSWVDFTVFPETIPETTAVEQVLYMDRSITYQWNYGPLSTTKGCVMCQYKQPDCSLPILSGVWTIPEAAWTASDKNLLKKPNIDRFILNLANGLNFFTATEPKGFVQIDLQQEFLLHLLKCSSLHGETIETVDSSGKKTLPYGFYMEYSFELYEDLTVVRDQKGNKLKFSCGFNGMELKSTKLIPPVVARVLQISWVFNAKSVSFTLTMELFGCPAYSSAKHVVNPQCGTEPSRYILVTRESYMCMFTWCPLSSQMCGPVREYYKMHDRSKTNPCSPRDQCASMPCNDGMLCLNFQNKYKCQCPQTVMGNCTYDLDMYVMVDNHVLDIGNTITLYLMVNKINSKAVYYINVTEDYSCIPDFKTISSKKGKYSCSTIKYYAKKTGSFTPTLRNRVGKRVESSNPANFRVTFPNLVTKKCLGLVRIIGAASNIEKPFPFQRNQDVHFSVSGTTLCKTLIPKPGKFKIEKYDWTLSLYKFQNIERCFTDEAFDVIKVKPVYNDGVHFFVSKGNLPLGYIKVCVKIKATELGKSYHRESCGFIQVIISHLKLVIEPTAIFVSIPHNIPVILDASKSLDPNTGTNSGIKYQWYCAMKKDNNTCDFVRHLYWGYVPKKPNMIPETNPILKIPGFKLKMKHTYVLTVVISKQNVVGDRGSVTVFSAKPTMPQLRIRCIFSCGIVVPPSKLLALEVDCLNCASSKLHIIKYKWILTSEKHGELPFSIWGRKVTTGDNKVAMVLQSRGLNITNVYTFEVVGTSTNRMTGKAVYVFETNSPPTDGSCSISPKMGTSLTTHFTVVCSGYLDPHKPLHYRIHKNNINQSDTILCYGFDNTMNFILPEGPKEHDFQINLTVTIMDSFETSTFVHLSVQSFSPEVKNMTRTEFYKDIVTDMVAENHTSHAHHRDFLRLAGTVVEMLGKESHTSESENKMQDKIRESLLSGLLDIRTKDEHMLLQKTDIALGITSQEHVLPASMEDSIMNMASQLTDSLFNVSKDAPTESRIIAKKQMVNLNMLMELFSDTEKKKKVLNLFEEVGDAMLRGIQSDAEEPLVLQTKERTMSLKWSKTDVKEFNLGASMKDNDDVSGMFSFPMADTLFKYNKGRKTAVKSVNLQVQITEKNPYFWSPTAKNVNLPVLMIAIKNRNELDKLNLTNLPKPADIYISSNFSNLLEDDKVYTMNVSYNFRNRRVLASTALNLSIQVVKGKTQVMKIFAINTSLTLQLFLGTSCVEVNTDNIGAKGMDWPIPNRKLKVYKNRKQDPHLLFLPGDNLKDNHTYTLGIQVKPAQIVNEDIPTKFFQVKIGIKSFTAECSYWNEEHDEWRHDGCRVSPFTNLTSLHCWCDHLSAFSGGIFIAPNTVDPIGDAALFLTFFDNPVVITVIIGVWILYFLLLAWARRKDYEDLKKIGITVLADNNRTDTYVYLICVVTDWWRQAGTTSRVFIYLCGRHGQSARHALCDRERNLFTSGAENWFLLKTPYSLGRIRSVVIWHDNTGPKPSWYLKEIFIQDVQTNDSWHCLYDEWLSVDKGYGLVHADIPSIENKTFAQKHFYQFTQTSSKDFRNGHIWLSIFAKAPTSTFTRKQRLVCALSILLSTMLANIMYHGIPRGEPEDQVDYGDFHLSLADLVIGIQSAVMMFPINILIIQMFNMLAPKPCDAAESEQLKRATDNMKQSQSKKMKSMFLKPYVSKGKKMKRFMKCRLPWYFIYVAYTLSFMLSMVCSYFIMLYGLKYGYHKSVAWIISFSTSLFQSVCISQPVKVFTVALLLTILFKHTVQYKSGKVKKSLEKDEEYLHREILEKDGAVMASDELTKPPKHYVPPLSRRILRAIRKRIQLDNRTREILQEIIMYFSFVAVCMLVIMGHRDVTQSYHVTTALSNMFVEASYGDKAEKLYDVTDSESMWSYLENTVLKNLMSGEDDSITNSVASLVGRAGLRQIRIKKEASCITPSELDQNLKPSQTCHDSFNRDAEETRSYNKNWQNQTIANKTTMWTYQSSSQLNTLPIMGKLHTYPGGGFVVQLPRNAKSAQDILKEVTKTAWIDEHTRLVIVEFTLYNPNVKLFSVVLILFEYTNLGLVIPYHQIITANFYHYRNQFETFVAVCEALFVIYLICFTYIEIKQFNRLKWRLYFKDIWNIIELTILALAYSIIGLFINRVVICHNLMAHFSDTDFEEFVSFYTAAFYDSILTYVMAFLILITIIKFFKLLRFNIRLSSLAHTLQSAKGKLTAYAFGIFGFVMAYAALSHLVFGTKLVGYRSFGRTIVTLFLFMLGQTDYFEVKTADIILGPVFFFFFAMTFKILFMHYFITLLLDAIKTTKANLASVKTEVHMVDFIMKRFRLLFMLDKTKKKAEQEKLYKTH